MLKDTSAGVSSACATLGDTRFSVDILGYAQNTNDGHNKDYVIGKMTKEILSGKGGRIRVEELYFSAWGPIGNAGGVKTFFSDREAHAVLTSKLTAGGYRELPHLSPTIRASIASKIEKALKIVTNDQEILVGLPSLWKTSTDDGEELSFYRVKERMTNLGVYLATIPSDTYVRSLIEDLIKVENPLIRARRLMDASFSHFEGKTFRDWQALHAMYRSGNSMLNARLGVIARSSKKGETFIVGFKASGEMPMDQYVEFMQMLKNEGSEMYPWEQ